MRHGLMACAAVFALSGCIMGNPHNDVLVFGTTTKVALDVSAPVQNGALPEFTLGYKRNEGVWMPLKPNGAPDPAANADRNKLAQQLTTCTQTLAQDFDREVARAVCIADIVPKDKYVSYSAGIDPSKGGSEAELDTYSVFASFGGRGGLGFNSSSGQLAQFFATGIAAQRLGANPQLAAALNADGATAVVKQAEADKAKAELDKALVLTQAAETDAATKLKAEWKACADPAVAAEKTNYDDIADATATALQDAPFGPYLKRLQTKDKVIERLLDVHQERGVEAFRAARTTKCGEN